MNQYRALLCDLDGTLADSEPLHCAAWLELLNGDYGLGVDENWFEQFIGTSDRVVARHVTENHGLDVAASELTRRKQAAFHAAVRQRARSFPGVPELLGELAARYPVAIATNSGRADADLMIEALGFDRIVSVSVTASDVAHMKPAPDIYALAAARLGVPAERCIAIEDSGPGGQSARAAGCYLLGLTDAVTDAHERIDGNAAALRRAGQLLGE